MREGVALAVVREEARHGDHALVHLTFLGTPRHAPRELLEEGVGAVEPAGQVIHPRTAGVPATAATIAIAIADSAASEHDPPETAQGAGSAVGVLVEQGALEAGKAGEGGSWCRHGSSIDPLSNRWSNKADRVCQWRGPDW
ncbi:hypothetical protein GCM10010230_22420 [Streptomyces narbonensis]|nr:hypothetical protein GCM10010230_22420 [Streptomyces narbonensis]